MKLSSGDKTFLKLYESGVKMSPAFREAYPEHNSVIMWNRSEPGSPDRRKASLLVHQAAKFKLQTKYMTKALTTYQDSMERFSELSVATAIELVQSARSEKVRADLAIEGMRQKVGSPTQKIQSQESKVVYLTFGEPPKDEREIIDVPVENINHPEDTFDPDEADDQYGTADS